MGLGDTKQIVIDPCDNLPMWRDHDSVNASLYCRHWSRPLTPDVGQPASSSELVTFRFNSLVSRHDYFATFL